MSWEDFTFTGSLLLCCAAGAPYRQLEPHARRTYGAALGLLVLLLVCGAQALHALPLTLGNLLIMYSAERCNTHRWSLVYSWCYLLYLHLTVRSRYALGLYQTLVLRLVGLASELHAAHRVRRQTAGGLLAQRSADLGADDAMGAEPSAVDVLLYTFNYIGIHKGPYYKWKTFNDYFTMPFGTTGDCRAITEQKFKKMALFSVLYVWLSTYYPVHAYEEVDFYYKKGPDYRFLYGAPQLARYVLGCQVAALLSTAACSEAGFAVYPAEHYATVDDSPELTSVAGESGPSQQYNFAAIKCFDNGALVAGPSMRRTLRGWDVCLQQWFWAHVYRKLDHPNRLVKKAITFTVWCIWSGPSVNQFILGLTLWGYIYLEDVYSDICGKYTTPTGSELVNKPWLVWSIGFSLARLLCLVYVAPCLVLPRGAALAGYYCSVYWALHVALAAAALAAGAGAATRPRAPPAHATIHPPSAAADLSVG